MSAQLRQTDPTRGMSLVSTISSNREATRYLFTPGQFLDPERVAQLEHIAQAGGGEEVEAHTLRRTKGKFIPRAFLTPMEIWPDSISPELLSEGAEGVVQIVDSMTPENLELDRPKRPGQLIGRGLVHHKYYPGDEVGAVLRGVNSHGPRGIIEVKSLMGQKWYLDEAETIPGAAQMLNHDFFPIPPPIELSAVREAIDKGATRSDIHRTVANELQTSCDLFERWARARLAAEHGLLRERKTHQYVHSYTPLACELLRQLEMKPQDNILEGMSSGLTAEQLRDILGSVGAQQQSITPEIIGTITAQVVQAILAAQEAGRASAAETPPVSDDAPASEVEAPKNGQANKSPKGK
jgi:hypothetical protein